MSVVRVDPSGGSDRTSTMIEHRRSVTLLALLPFLLSGNYFFFPLFFLSLSLFLRLGRIDHLHQYSSTSCPRDETYTPLRMDAPRCVSRSASTALRVASRQASRFDRSSELRHPFCTISIAFTSSRHMVESSRPMI